MNQLAVPSRKQEGWKYQRFASLQDRTWQTPDASGASAWQCPETWAKVHRIVLVDGIFSPAHSHLPTAGCTFESQTGQPTFETKTGFHGFFPETPFLSYRLHITQTLTEPLYVIHGFSGRSGLCIQPHIEVQTDAKTESTLCELLLESQDPGTFWNSSLQFQLAEKSHCQYFHIQAPAAGALVHQIQIQQASQSQWQGHSLVTGAAQHRTQLEVKLLGSHATASTVGIFLGEWKRQVDWGSSMVHATKDTGSRQLVKGIAADHAHCAYRGMVHVHPHASRADGKMHNHNLVLDPTAQVQTLPSFQIEHDQVVCNHGATVGQLREDELFYLETRAIPRVQAEHLLSRAFLEAGLAGFQAMPPLASLATACLEAFFAHRWKKGN